MKLETYIRLLNEIGHIVKYPKQKHLTVLVRCDVLELKFNDLTSINHYVCMGMFLHSIAVGKINAQDTIEVICPYKFRFNIIW